MITRSFKTIAILSLALVGASANATELATVGGASLTDKDLKGKLGSLPPVQKEFLNKDERARARLVENFVMEELFVQEADKSGLTKNPEFVQELDNQRRQLLARLFLKEKVEAQLTAKTVKSFFDKNKTKYRTDEVRAFHILVKTKAEADELHPKAAAAKNDEEFQALAKKHSQDPSVAQNMGDLGFFSRSRMIPEFADAAFKMKKGEISKPVQTPFGFHIIKLIDTKQGQDADFESVEPRVKNDLRGDLTQKLVEDLKKKRNVKINDSNVNSLKF
jgi:parvulin-like peptidyl-prolyl isomerase